MKKIKYKIGRKEDIGDIEHGALIDVYIIKEDPDSSAVLVYFPQKIVYASKGREKLTDKGWGSISFAKFHEKGYYVRYGEGYVNLTPKAAKEFEKAIKL